MIKNNPPASDVESVPTDHFEALYARSEDPWGYEAGGYEQQKYHRTIALLPQRRYNRAFELGCSIGVLTQMLSLQCDHILGGDCSTRAIALAQDKRTAPNTEFRVMRAPLELPYGQQFDLIVLSEVLYFFSAADMAAVIDFVRNATPPSAIVVLVNYLGPTDHAASGDEAAEAFIFGSASWSKCISQVREEHFRIDVIERSA